MRRLKAGLGEHGLQVLQHLVVCSAMPPGTKAPVLGSIGICPEVNSMLPTRIACEYGPMAAGASGVDTADLALAGEEDMA